MANPSEYFYTAEIQDLQLHRPLLLDQLAAAHTPASVTEVLCSMLATDPKQRPASATELHERLEHCLATLKIQPVSSTEPLRPANTILGGLKEHRVYRLALGYAVGAWIILQAAAIVLPGFAAPPWVLPALMILLAAGFGVALLAGWSYDRHVVGKPLVPRAPRGRLGWIATALLPAAAVAAFFLLRPLPRPNPIQRAAGLCGQYWREFAFGLEPAERSQWRLVPGHGIHRGASMVRIFSEPLHGPGRTC